MRKEFYLVVLLFIISGVFTACRKESPAVAEAVAVKTYLLADQSGAVAGNFSITSNREGVSVIAIELNSKSHHHGTTYTAMICAASTSGCYARLADVNAVTGYGETVGVCEQSTGRRLSAEELSRKTGYVLSIAGSDGPVASGYIR